jgi:hypothetical protein
METSPNTFHGTGVSKSPAAAPLVPISKSLLETFIVAPSFMTTEATNLDMMTAVAIFAVAHLHAVMGSAPEARDGVTPNIAAVAANAVLLINSRLIRFPEVSMAITTGEASQPGVGGVREPDIFWLPPVHQPGNFPPALYVVIHQDGFRFGCAKFIGMAAGAGFDARDTGEFAGISECVAALTLCEAGFFTVSFVMKFQWLDFTYIQRARERDPTCHHRKCETNRKDN